MKILLIHGLGRTPLSMWGLSAFLRSHHHEPSFFSYASWYSSYAEIVQRLRSHLKTLSQSGSYGIVAHSLGGLLCRSALSDWDRTLPQHIVMLGTPNQLPQLGKMAWNVPLFQWIARDCGYNLSHSSFYETLDPLPCPYSVIAGNAGPRGRFSPFGKEPNDGIVAVKETVLRPSDRPIERPVFHTFMMNDPWIQKYIFKSFQRRCKEA